MPDPDHLRKQAKLYVRWHRDRHVPVAAQIRRLSPRFAAATDADILASSFRLCDAQEMIAHEHGFATWPALIRGLSPMQASDHPAASTNLAAEPQLCVAEMAVALRFYVETLGFEIVFSWGEPGFYAQVARGGARLNLRLMPAAALPQRRPNDTDVLAATLTLDDAKPLFLEYQRAGAAFHQRLRTEPWGARTFIVRDPDGNLLAFAGS